MRKGQKKVDEIERSNFRDDQAGYCSPGSIEQQLDMCETGALRGDQISHDHGMEGSDDLPSSDQALDKILNQYYEPDLAEQSREGDEMSGDEHSSGLQGEDSEFTDQGQLDTGLPRDESRRTEKKEQTDGAARLVAEPGMTIRSIRHKTVTDLAQQNTSIDRPEKLRRLK